MIESPRKYTSIRPCFAFSSSCACAVIEFGSVRGAGRSAGSLAGVSRADVGAPASALWPEAPVRTNASTPAITTSNAHLLTVAADGLLRARRGRDRRGMFQELVGPGDEVLPIGSVGVAAV